MKLAVARVPALPRYGAQRHVCKVGILGGSFDPAHDGHLALSREALKCLQLDAVWWLVTPQNPLKAHRASELSQRLAQARQVARSERRIRVLVLEQAFGTRATVPVLRLLRARNPRSRLIWLMGADCLSTLDQWQQAERLFTENPVAIFTRPGYTVNSKYIKSLVNNRSRYLLPREARIFDRYSEPVWTVIRSTRNYQSSTALRRQQQENS